MDRPRVFRDALPLLSAALAELGPGQLVKVADVALVQLLSAIEIMDPRTDAYVAHTLASSSAATDPLPKFDPTLELLPDELVWILDELFRLEVTHLDGHPLVSTLFTCHYIRPRALAELSAPTPGSNPTQDPNRRSGFRNIVLRAMLLGTLKCAETVWDELCKGQVYEYEDVHLSLSGQSFTELLASAFPPLPVSPLRVAPAGEAAGERVVSVDDVLEALDVAQNWLVDNMDDSPTRDGLLGRIAIRMETVYVVALLISPPQTNPEQLRVHFSRILPAITTINAPQDLVPSPALKAVFAKGSEPPLPSNQPIREIPPFALGEAWNRWSAIVVDLENLAKVWEGWRGGDGWAGVREYFVSLGRRDMMPYPRSVHQSVFFSSRLLFATDPPIHLVSSFFNTVAGVPFATWDTLDAIRETESAWNSPARRVLGWADRVGGFLVATVTVACQNRARARRIVVKTRDSGGQLVDEASEFIPIMKSLLPPTPSLALVPFAIMALHLSQLLEALLSGFELSLYGPDEWIQVWWVAERLVGKLEETWAALRSPDRLYVEASWIATRIVRAMCTASVLAFSIGPPAQTKMISPLLSYNEPVVMAQARFERRFGWLEGSCGGDAPLESLTQWADFDAASKAWALLPSEDLAQQSSLAYREAVGHLTAFSSIPLTARGVTVRPETQLKWVAALRRTCYAGQNALAAFPKVPASAAAPPIKWDSPWFPVRAWSEA